MRNIYIIIAILFSNLLFAQQNLKVHNSGNTMYAIPTNSVDSIKLDSIYSKIKVSNLNNTINFQKTLIDSITFSSTSVSLDKIYIIYNGNEPATIINPYAASGVTIAVNAATVMVTATSGISNLEYNILGFSNTGSLTISTDKDVNLVLNNLTLTNPNGAAFAISGGKVSNFLLTPNSVNTLSDGIGSSKNGTITTDGPIKISNTGVLKITGIAKHGINTSSNITIENGNTTIASAATDGLHSEGFTMNGGALSITSLSDGIDAGNGAIDVSGGSIKVTSTSENVKAIRTGTNTINISGGNIDLVVSGAQSKGINSKGIISISNGNIGITLSGVSVQTASGSGFDISHATAIKTDTIMNISGGNFIIKLLNTADGGKGFSSDYAMNITGGIFDISTAGNGGNYMNISGLADSYSTSSFSSKSNINISGGSINITNSGLNGKGISTDKDVNISSTALLTINNSGNAGKGIKADGDINFDGGNSTFTNSGNIVLTTSGSGFDPSYPTGVKATGKIVVNSGKIVVNGTSTASGAKGFSADNGIVVNNGEITMTIAGNGTTFKNSLGTTDAYSAAAFSSDLSISINNGTVNTTCSGSGGKGLKSDGKIFIGTATTSPTVNITTTGARFLVSGKDYSHPKTIVSAGPIQILNGSLTINSTDDGIHSDTSITISGGNHIINAISTTTGVGEGVEAPLINFTGGTTNINASNDGINATYSTVAGGTEQNDNSNVNISGGVVIVFGKDAIDSNGNITISGGVTIVCGVTSSPEEGLDFNGALNITGGFIIAAGANSNMTKNFSATSTQNSMFLKSSAQLAATSMLHIQSASGEEMVTFKPKNGVYYFHFSSPSVLSNTSYQVYFGGTYTGGKFEGGSTGWGLYSGGTYSNTGATLKTTFTTSATSKINTITF